jgi:hypothetical protein
MASSFAEIQRSAAFRREAMQGALCCLVVWTSAQSCGPLEQTVRARAHSAEYMQIKKANDKRTQEEEKKTNKSFKSF